MMMKRGFPYGRVLLVLLVLWLTWPVTGGPRVWSVRNFPSFGWMDALADTLPPKPSTAVPELQPSPELMADPEGKYTPEMKATPDLTATPEMKASPDLTATPEMMASPGGPFLPGISLTGTFPSEGFLYSGAIGQTPELPAFDFREYLASRWKVETPGSLFSGFYGNARLFPGGMPLFYGGTMAVFNQAAYQFSDRLRMGGNSFGVNPPWVAPGLPGGQNRYDFRGASLFMEYKVSKNFRIETRVSVSGSPHSP
ncbi:MAG TPA: hypothetical protein PLX49_05900 [Prolixibacteraceae bacterium]|nr:hypothetical protein [Prolixibacteraceae bacterium]